MNRQTIRVIISLAVVLLIGLITTQIFWVQKAYQLQEEQMDYDITQSLKRVAQQVLLANNDSTQLYDPIEQVSPELFRVRIRESIQPYYLQTLLENEFRNAEINLDFEYALYDCFTDSVVFRKSVLDGTSYQKTESKAAEVNWTDDAHYFSVYFPNKTSVVMAQLDFWIFSSILLFVIVLFFGYTISVILKQRRLSEIKTDFINNMTHELKTPISTISLSSKVLLKKDIEKTPERLRNYAAIIEKENNRLQLQVEKVLQIAAIEKDRFSINKKDLNIHELLKDAIEVISFTVTEKGGTLTTQLQAENPIIKGDEVHIANIFANLLDNAIKYTPQNPQIQVVTKSDGQTLYISFIDNGIGIEKKAQKHIFEKFYRVPKGDVHDVKGFGIGLHYVKLMVGYHKGDIYVESEPGKGTKITITLPLK